MSFRLRVHRSVAAWRTVSVVVFAAAAFAGGRLMSARSRRVALACLGAAVVVLLTMLGSAQQAQTRTWDGGGAGNNWSTAGNWSADNAPDGTQEAALFTNDPAGQTKLTPNLSADVTIGQLQFSATAPSYTITGTGPSTLFLSPTASFGGVGVIVASGAASQTIAAAEVEFLSSQTWDIGGTTTLTVTGTIEDDSVIDYGLTKNGTGTLVFPGDVRYDGATVVNAGSLILSFSNTSMLSALTVNGGLLRGTTSVNALGNSGTRNTITLAGGALELANNTGLTFGSTSRITSVTGNAAIRSDRLTAGAGVTHRLGTLRIGAQTLSVAAGTNTTNGTAGTTFGATTLLGNATFDVVNSGSASAQLTLGAAGQSGGTRSLTKSGNGTLVLNGAASYTGGTTLRDGAITLGVANALGSGGFIFAGGALNGNNTTDSTIGALTITANSTLRLSPGGAAATLTFAGVSGAASGLLTITGWSGSAGGLGTNDRIVFSGGTTPSADFLQHIRFDLGDGNTYVGALGAGGELYPIAGGPTSVAVPDVAWQTQSNAANMIVAAGLTVGTVTNAPSSTVPADSVLSQSPASGTVVSTGTAVALVISSGPDGSVAGTTGAIEVVALPPNLNGGQFISQTHIRLMHEGTGIVTAGMPAFQADGAYHDPALGIGQPADATFANAIVTPFGGPGLPAVGTAVDSILLHFDPNVSDLPFDLSQGVAQSATITFTRPIIGVYVTSNALDVTDAVFGSGTVYPIGNIGRDMEFNYDGDYFSISPDRLTLSVTMFSHNGGVLDEMRVLLPAEVTPITVPNVVGSTQEQASSTLAGVGLVASATTQPSPTIPLGTVIGQSPAAGASVATGSTVILVVSAGVTVPSVVGQTQSSATATITAAGFLVSSSTQASASVPLGSVISQHPAGGTAASGGSTVALVISSGAPANITLANVQSAQSTASGSFVDLVYTVPNIAGSPVVLVVYGGAEASTTNLALPAGATFHGVAMNVAAQHRTPASGINAGAGLYWLPVSPNESGTIRLSFTGTCDERAVGAVTLVGAASTGPEVVETATGTASLTDQITTLSANAIVISTATQGNNGALTATGTAHALDVSAALASSRMAGGHADVAAPASRTLGYSGSINRVAMILASFPVSAPSGPLVTLPDVTNMLRATAQSTLTGVGLQSGAITTAHSSTVPADYVISQNPAAGASVPSGSSVNLLVSLGAPPNVPPGVTLTAPADRATGLGSSALLAAAVTDADATTVTFYGRRTAPAVPGPDFVIGTLPDTQFYSQNTGGNLAAIFFEQTQWYADSRAALNVAFVSHLGDMVQSGDNGSNNSEWNVADTAMRTLEDPVRTGLPYGIPWGGAPGNHDQTTVGQVNAPNAKWNQFFGADRWAGRPYFGGSFSPTNNSNNYQLFEASGLAFLIIHLDYTTAAAVDQAVIDWADALMKAYPQRRAIVTSHWILDAPPGSPIGASAPFGGPGQRFVDEFKDNPNFFLMLSGHVHDEGRRTDVFGGRTIHTVLQDYQDRPNGGNGWLRYFVFSPANNTITARTYSPTLDQFESDTDATSSPGNQASEFVLPYDMQGAVAPWTVLGTVTVAAGGGSAQFNWTGLEEGSTYEWYVGASDGVATTTSTARIFSTSDSAAPSVTLTSPANNAVFTTPVDITLTATASDIAGTIAKVEFFAGATKLGEDTTSPYSYTWTNAPAGSHSLTARATDDETATTTSASVAITVNSPLNVPPTVTLTAPASNASFTAPVNVTLTATAGDTDGSVTKVEFFAGTTKLGEDTTAPHGYTWTNAPVGSHVLTAVATDNAAATATSTSVAIIVNPPPNVPPTVSLTAPPNNTVFTTPVNVTLTATAGDTDGTITLVEFFQGATKLGEDATSPYSYTWNGVPSGSYSLTARATDNSNATTTSSAVTIIVNTPPSVALTAPANGATFATPGSITLTASASDTDGTVTLVEFYSGATKLGEDATSPYTYTWTNPAAGSPALTARATDNRGAATVSSSVTIQITGTTPAGLVAAYDFDDGSGTVLTDVTGRGHNGTISGATWTSSGHSGSALTFSGSARVTVGDANDLDLTTGMTLEAWVFPTQVPTNWTTVILKENSPELSYALYAGTAANRPEAWVFIGGDRGVIGTAAVPQNAWTHLAATYDGATLRLYVNGVQVASRAQTGAIQTSSGALSIGGNGVWGEYFRGRLDDVRIYNRALSAAEVQNDMKAPVQR